MPQPNKIPLAFAASGDKNVIPESTETTGLASWRDGFPAITSAPFSEGGIAPKRADFNGIFNALSLATVWQQQGGFYAYDATTDYEVGNVVEYNNDLYKCRTANGPSSSVKAPTDTTVWSKVMTSADDVATIQSGTWTPVLKGGSVAGTFTYSAQDGRYIKIGNLVYIVGQVQITDYGTYPTGGVVIDGLPFVGNNSVYSFGMCVQGYNGGVDNSVLKIASGYVNKNSTLINCLSHSKSAPQNMSNATWSSSSTSGYEVMLDASHKNATLYISGVYLTI